MHNWPNRRWPSALGEIEDSGNQHDLSYLLFSRGLSREVADILIIAVIVVAMWGACRYRHVQAVLAKRASVVAGR